MTADIKEFRPGILQEIGQEPNKMVVTVLEKLLQKAKSGEIIAIAGAALMDSNGDVITFRGNSLHSVYELIGALDGIKSEILFDVNMINLQMTNDD